MSLSEAISIVLVTVPSNDEGERIAAALLDQRLVACVNILPNISSHYRWQGSLQKNSESLLILKTRSALFERVREQVVSLHPYDVPEIVELKSSAVYQAYADWVLAETKL